MWAWLRITCVVWWIKRINTGTLSCWRSADNQRDHKTLTHKWISRHFWLCKLLPCSIELYNQSAAHNYCMFINIHNPAVLPRWPDFAKSHNQLRHSGRLHRFRCCQIDRGIYFRLSAETANQVRLMFLPYSLLMTTSVEFFFNWLASRITFRISKRSSRRSFSHQLIWCSVTVNCQAPTSVYFSLRTVSISHQHQHYSLIKSLT